MDIDSSSSLSFCFFRFGFLFFLVTGEFSRHLFGHCMAHNEQFLLKVIIFTIETNLIEDDHVSLDDLSIVNSYLDKIYFGKLMKQEEQF
ncbi:hypothetical protein BLOT_003061 [Blomia tropicalis]|nr:hypothetical protein BLOT_003061 [Blomia tropicalis]